MFVIELLIFHKEKAALVDFHETLLCTGEKILYMGIHAPMHAQKKEENEEMKKKYS